ncbi:amidohydrolase family protein [Pseudonocardia sp. CA-107938]|uniref:amidohydrolase family protein n=1 Tax=Pseudonocardia sp. CA-107938 TaxID=3240021 RepID=UPI003D8F9BA6
MQVAITNGHVVPGAGAPELPAADVLVEDGVIVAVGAGAATGSAGEVIDATGLVVVPGLVDTHHHVAQAPLRGTGADLTLPAYLDTVIGRYLPAYRPQDVRLATLLGALESLDAGITTVLDWAEPTKTPEHTDAVVAGLTAAGIRAVVGHTAPGDEDDVRRLAARTGLVTGAVASLGPEWGTWEQAVHDIELARELGVPVTIHAQGGGADPVVPRLHAAGLLGPDLLLVHLNAATDEDVQLLVAAGVGVAVSPCVEPLMGHGTAPYGRFTDAGGRVALAVDVVINAAPDLFEPMRDVLRAERVRTGRMVPAASLLAAATEHGAAALGMADRIGTIAPGKRADLLLVDGLSHVEPGTAAGAVVATAGPAQVRTVLVDGHVVKRDGRLVGHDLDAVRAEAAELAVRVRAA